VSPLFATIVMPALNEEKHILAAIASVVPRSSQLDYELLVVDGGSTDRTREIVAEAARANPRIKLLHNPKRIQSAAVNLAAQAADPRARYIVRADCHARYPKDFAQLCIATLLEKDVASVVVPMQTIGSSCAQKAIAAAQNSRLGNGGSRHRLLGRSGFVDHGHHAAFDRAVFLALGGYNEAISHNEDAELDVRIIRSGRKIYLESAAAIQYFPRASFMSLAKQYRSFGWGTANTVLRQRTVPKLRRTLPVLVVVGIFLSLLVAPLDVRSLAFPALYALTAMGWGAALAMAARDPCVLMSGAAAIVMHVSWGWGFIARLLHVNASGGAVVTQSN
jgi:succinoglycan biosynthesis protein ExoA